jgi:HD-like signal output (HDOD) protein
VNRAETPIAHETREALKKKLEGLRQMPALPITLVPLLRYMEQPVDQMNMNEIVDLILQDNSLAAQCLYMANSPLFGRWQETTSVREAVITLGLQRMRDIAISCSLISLTPTAQTGIDPIVFWEHALGCALVSRQFAKNIGFADPSQAYLCGLLHDIGIVAHLWMIPNEFRAALQMANECGIPLHEAETEVLGINHAETGKAVAEHWKLPATVTEVAAFHHQPARASTYRSSVALVSLSDKLCRMSGLGHGVVEKVQVDFLEEPGVGLLINECPGLQSFDWARFTFEMDGYMEEVHRLVNLLFRRQ